MNRTWHNQFPGDFALPAELDALLVSGKLTDTSWGNDVCPSLECYTPGGHGLRVWVHHPEPKKRELATPKRFEVVELYEDEPRNYAILDQPPLLATDDVRQVVAFVLAQS